MPQISNNVLIEIHRAAGGSLLIRLIFPAQLMHGCLNSSKAFWCGLARSWEQVPLPWCSWQGWGPSAWPQMLWPWKTL